MRKELVLSLLFKLVECSYGDKSVAFQDCIGSCKSSSCEGPNALALPLSLRLTRWTCEDDCKYWCMHSVTKQGIVYQYYGKWPFWRFAGMQEPASVLFSLLNLYAHLEGGRRVRRQVPDGHPMKTYYLLWSYLNINAWIWSSVFHTRDWPITEKLDYFSAALAIMYSLCYTVIRLWHLYSQPSPRLSTSSRPRSPYLIPWILLCAVLYACHVAYLAIPPRFDYSYNMAANLAIGLIHNALWVLFATNNYLFPTPHGQAWSATPPYAYKAIIFVALTMAATSLELFDFPPWWGILDAHSLWHLSTVPIIPFWYSFLIEDSQSEAWRIGKL